MAASSNLSISVSADTKPARQDIELLNASVRSLRKEVRDLSNEAQQTGTIMPRLPEAIKQLEAAEAKQRAFRTATRATTAATDEAALSLAEMGKMMGGVARAAGVAIPGIKALRFGLLSLVGAEVVRGFNAVVDQITALSDASKKTGLDPAIIQQFGKALAETGGKAEDAAGMLEKLVGSFPAEKKQEMQAWWGAANDAARDGRPLASDYARAMQTLHVNMQQFGTDAKGLGNLSIAVARGLVDLANAGKIDEANQISLERFGKNWREVGAAVRAFVEATKGAPSADQGPFSPAALANIEAYNRAAGALGEAWKGLLNTLAESGVFVELVRVIDDFTAGLNNSVETIKTLIGWLQPLIDLGNEVAAVLNKITGISTDAGGGGDITGGASGGYVRGPGSGTSDSILARLSNGEFVMRAAAVEHWGPRFMAALNHLQNPFGHYGTGGLVQTTPRFASGGMVSARTRDGAIVNLHFPGGQFQLHGDRAIVAGLTREARRAGMLSAGRMPGALA